MKTLVSKADLILHPIRIQITAALSLKEANPKELAERLVGVPVSSLYRHLNLLLEGGVIEVAGSKRVGSVEEKTYRMKVSQNFGLDDMQSWTREQYEAYFTAAVSSIIATMKRYLELETDLEKVKRSSVWRVETLSVSEDAWEKAYADISSILKNLSVSKTGAKTREVYLISHPLKEES